MRKIKDPDAIEDFAFDWATSWLTGGETISSHSLFITSTEDPVTLTIGTHSEFHGVVTAWLSGGTAGIDYKLTCRISTSAGRTDDRTMTISVQNR